MISRPGRAPSLALIAFLLGTASLCLVPARLGFGLNLLPIWSDPTDEPAGHITDGQDRPGTGTLSKAGESLTESVSLYAQSVVFVSSHRPAEGLKELQRASDLDPHFADLQVHLANLYIQNGQSDQALSQLETAAQLNPDSAEIGGALSYCLRMHGHIPESDKLGYTVLQEDPGQTPAIRVILENAVDRGTLADGLSKIIALYASEGDRVSAPDWIELARLYDELARSDANTADSNTILHSLASIYQSAAAIQPPSSEALRLLAETYRDLDMPADYLRCLQESKALDPTNTDLLLRCAALEEDQNQPKAALVDYQAAYNEDFTLPGVQESLASLNLTQGNFTEATGLLEGLVQNHPTNLDYLVDLGIAYAGTGLVEKSNSCFLHLYTAPSDSPEPFLKLAAFQMGIRDLNQSSLTLKIARNRFPNSAYVAFLQGVEARHAKRYDQALTFLDQARDMALKSRADLLNDHFYVEEATTEALAGHHDKADSLLQEARQHFPNSPEVMNQMAYFYSSNDEHLNEALSLAEKAATLQPQDGQILDTLGWLYYQEKQPDRAVPYLQQAADLTNNDPEVCLHLGKVLSSLDHPRQAIQALSRGLATDPDNPELKKLLSKILSPHAQSRFSSRP